VIAYGLINRSIDHACNAPQCCIKQTAQRFSSISDTSANPNSAAFDGDTTTKWSSVPGDPQYIYVDLAAVMNICKIAVKNGPMLSHMIFNIRF